MNSRQAHGINEFIENLSQQIALDRALRTAFNRYATALNAGNIECEKVQKKAAQRYAHSLAGLLEQEPELLSSISKALIQGNFPAIAITSADVRNFETNIAANGLSSKDLATLTQLGATTDDINFIQQFLIVQDPVAVANLGGGRITQALIDPLILKALLLGAEDLEGFSSRK